MDNWFSTLPFLLQLKTMEILSIATFCSNQIRGCPLMSEKDLKKHCCGSFDYRTDYNTGTHMLKWFDNKCAVVGSSFAGVECTSTVERYDLARKKKVKINCPGMVSQYNRSVGGVDLADILIALFRTNIITRKRWYLKLIFHWVDIGKVNDWLLYRRHCQQKEVSKKLQMNLRNFTTQIASAFTLVGKDPKKNPLVGEDVVFPRNHQWEEIQLFHHQWQNGALALDWWESLWIVIRHALSNVLSVRSDYAWTMTKILSKTFSTS